PHGDPIPSREGTVDERELESLAAREPGDSLRVVRVGDRDGERLRYLAELGITPGTIVRIVARAPFGGPITLAVGPEERLVGPALAEQVLVEPL
ncbi:MAG TPA: FeoA family protein, partial [Gemmatimonadaceae bacterium]|nr:FeoA family protein [Gemmatimonadaceae bacterium]